MVKLVKQLPEISHRNVFVLQMDLKYVGEKLEICLKYAWDIPERYAGDMQDIVVAFA